MLYRSELKVPKKLVGTEPRTAADFQDAQTVKVSVKAVEYHLFYHQSFITYTKHRNF